jgi:PAS domain S-box-containing protein
MINPGTTSDARLTLWVRLAAAALVVLSGGVLAGGSGFWTAWWAPALPAMAVTTALMFFGCAAGLFASASGYFRTQMVIGVALLVIALPAAANLGAEALLPARMAAAARLPFGTAAALLMVGLTFIAGPVARLRSTSAGLSALSMVVLASFAIVERVFRVHQSSGELFQGMSIDGAGGILLCAFGLLLLGWRDSERIGQLPRWLPHASATSVCGASMLLSSTLMATYPGEAGPLVFVSTLALGIAIAVLTGTSVRLMQLARERASQTEVASRALAEQEAKYRQIVTTASDIIYRADASGYFTFVNAAAERILQTPGTDLVGLHYLALIRPDVRDVARAFYEEQAAQHRVNSYYEFPLITGAGAEIWIGQNVEVLVENGVVAGFQGVARDITERKAMERALQHAHDRALDSARLKSEFLANMSHEIRTPMNGVVGLTSLLVETPLTPSQRSHVEGIRASGAALLTLINDILDSSKIEAGMLQIETIAFDLRATLASTLQIFAEAARHKRLTLAVDVADDVASGVKGDPGRLRQVLTNLIGNGLKFTRDGDVRVHVSRSRETADDVSIRFEVRDSGIGMSPDAVGRIFQPFVQADSSTTRRFGGTGLGLAISKRLVELMGGEIGVESTPGHGSVFWFVLPFIKPHPGEVSATLNLPPDASMTIGLPANHPSLPPTENTIRIGAVGGPLVLVAEDNVVNQTVARGLLQSLGCSVDVVADGVEALEALDRRQYAVVLMDCQMPRMDGFTATMAIRTLEGAGRRLPVIALTAYAGAAERDRCLQAGMDDYLSKPVSKADLARVLTRWTPLGHVTASDCLAATPQLPAGVNAERVAEVQAGLGGEIFAELVEMLVADATGSGHRLKQYVNAGLLAEVEQEAHRLKGSSRALGFERLGGVYHEIEQLAQERSVEGLDFSLLRLADERASMVEWWSSAKEVLAHAGATQPL